MLKSYQFWLGIGSPILALSLSLGLPMIVSSTRHNGILITSIGVAISVPFFIRAFVLYRRKTKSQETEETKSDDLTKILTEMHRRMMHLKTGRLKQQFNQKEFEDATPLLLDKLGLVKLNHWDDFKKKVGKRIKRRIPKSPDKLKKTGWYYKVVGAAREIKRELLDSQKLQIKDAVIVGEHLDSLHIGLGELRDRDEEWKALFERTTPYMTDPILRDLINKHTSVSYASCSVSLLINYYDRLPKDSFSRLLYSGLVDRRSDISPSKIEIALSEILEDMTKRLKILYERRQLHQSIAVKPSTGKKEADYERTEHVMWAELQVTNTGTNELKDVQVNITKCLTLQGKQGSVNRNDFVMWNQPEIKPFCVYWSERQAQSRQMNLVIPSGATRSALVAFQDNLNGGQFNFNSLNHEWIVGGVKIDVEISSHEAVLWNGDFYIECHPNYLGGERAKFEFVEWDTWVKGKNITQLDFDR